MDDATGLGVATFNAASGRSGGVDGPPVVDPALLEGSAAALADLGVDVLAVQEVDREQDRSAGVDQVAALARGFGGTAWRFAPTLTGLPGPGRTWQPWVGDGDPDDRQPDGPSYGIGLVSRLPVLAWRVRWLRGSRAVLPMAFPGRRRWPQVIWVPDEPRAALAAVVQTAAGPVTVISTHLSFSPPAALRQLRTVLRWSASLPGPHVLAGDLNLPGPVAARTIGWRMLASARTYPAPEPRVQLDHLLTDHQPTGQQPTGPAAADGHAVRLAVSDHRALVGRLRLG